MILSNYLSNKKAPFGAGLTITSSLNVDGGITGSLLGTASYALNALTASYALNTNINTLKTKAGSVSDVSFTGNPRKSTVTFVTPFDNNYAIAITGEDSRTFTIESKLSGSFIINTNSSVAMTGTTYWTATEFGEN